MSATTDGSMATVIGKHGLLIVYDCFGCCNNASFDSLFGVVRAL